MLKFIIATFVGGIIIFAWSAIAWMATPIHKDAFKKANSEEQLLSQVNSSLPESGAYMLPSGEMEKSQPFASIFYVKEGSQMGAMQFIFGFLLDLILAAVAVIMLSAASLNLTTFFQRWWLVMLVAVIQAMVYVIYWHWMGFPWHFVKGDILDTFVSWGLCGAWLSWYLGRN